MSNLVSYAERELRLAGLFDKDSDYGGMLGPAILDIVTKFSDQGHSGFSAGMVSSALDKLLRYEPLTPLTGADDEWATLDYEDEMAAQNKRHPGVFKRADGTAYHSDAIVFRDPDGACFVNSDSRKDITFPYTPTREYRDRPASAVAAA